MTQLICGTRTAVSLQVLSSRNIAACDEVKAAIAYGARNRLDFLEQCAASGKYLTFYGRYDHTVPIDVPLLEWFLEKGPSVATCKVVPDLLHAKVIWWVGIGAYIGSANLTHRAWSVNLEAGTYFNQEELESTGMLDQIATFFAVVEDAASPLTPTIVEEMKRWARIRQGVETENMRQKAEFERTRSIKPKENVSSGGGETITPNEAAFKKNWAASVQAMLHIATLVILPENKPSWISSDASPGAQADQFVHAYYYQRVKGPNNSHPYENFHQANRLNKTAVLAEVLAWWKQSDFDHVAEERTLNIWAPRLKQLLARDKLPKLSNEEFIEALSHVHAITDYASRQPNFTLDLPFTTQSKELKVQRHCERLLTLRSAEGTSLLQTLNYVVWGSGRPEDRIWKAITDNHWKIPGVGSSALGEIIGWARGDETPPRNDRTVKGLRALGFDVLAA